MKPVRFSCAMIALLAANAFLLQPAHAEGVTILIHGWQLGTSEPWWTDSMQAAIDDQWLDDEGRFGKITVTGTVGNLTATCSPWNVDLSSSNTGEIVVRVDWHAVANHLISRVPAQDVAAVVASKIYDGQSGMPPLAELPVHLVGHSRGGGMVCELARLLGEQGIDVTHVTPLDPHPLTVSDPQPIPPVIDTPVAVYENVLFIDNYWQDIDWPEGEYVTGAYNREWTSMPGGYHGHPTPSWDDVADHLNIHLMYHGTVDLNTPAYDGEDTVGVYERTNWFNDYETEDGIGGKMAGFYYSRIGGEADYLSTDIPTGSGDRIVDGYHDDPLLGGSGSRSSLTWSSAMWPNVLTLHILDGGNAIEGNDHYVVVGDARELRYTYRDYDSGTDFTFFYDADRNPYNANTIATISTESHAATGANLAQATTSWNTSLVPADVTGYVGAEITDGSRTRYFYAMPKVHTLSSAPSAMTPPGRALDFDRTDDYVALPADISSGLGTITIEAWVKSNTLSEASDYRAIVSERNAGDGTIDFELFLDGPNHTLSAGFHEGSWHTVSDATSFPTGEWAHTAATYDGHYLRLYRNGQQVAVSPDLSLSLPNSTGGWRIGRSHDSGDAASLWSGEIDEVRVWNTAHSESEIQASMNAVLSGDESGLVAYYRCDHTSGSLLWDQSANEYHGTLMNTDNADWVISTAPVGHCSHLGIGTNDLTETAEVPVDLTWDDDPGANAIFAVIQVNDVPGIISGLPEHYDSTYWELWIAEDDGNWQSDAAFHFDNLNGIVDETRLVLYTRTGQGQSWTRVNGTTLDDEGGTSDGVGSITVNDLTAFSQFMIGWSDPVTLVCTMELDTLVLVWNAVPTAGAYWVYGAINEPYFDAQVESPFEYRVAVTADTTWSSSAGIADPDTNWTYQVIAVDGTENELVRSNRVGEHEHLLP